MRLILEIFAALNFIAAGSQLYMIAVLDHEIGYFILNMVVGIFILIVLKGRNYDQTN